MRAKSEGRKMLLGTYRWHRGNGGSNFGAHKVVRSERWLEMGDRREGCQGVGDDLGVALCGTEVTTREGSLGEGLQRERRSGVIREERGESARS
jgi:hypothetical protein